MFDPYQEEEMREERIAICMFDGGLTYAEAVQIAAAQLFEAMRTWDSQQKANRPLSAWQLAHSEIKAGQSS